MTQLRVQPVALIAAVGWLLAATTMARSAAPVTTAVGARAVGAPAVGARGAVDADQFRRDLQALCAAPSRVVGSAGYAAAGAYLEREIRSLPNVELRRHDFPVIIPVTRHAAIHPPGHAPRRIYPFWPAGVRVNALPTEGVSGTLVYIGGATHEEINPAALRGQIAVLEASAGERWTNAFVFGARAALVLGTAETNNVELRSHEVSAPVDLPRFYVPPGPLADDLRAGRLGAKVTLRAAVDWQRTTASNFYALVRPRTAAPGAATSASGGAAAIAGSTERHGAALMISVPYDAGGLVPDLAKGASQASQTACGLALLRALSAEPLNRPVVLFFSGGDALNMLATRHMLMALADPPATWRPELAELDAGIRAARDASQRLHRAAVEPFRLDPARDRAAIDRVAVVIETDAALEQDELFRLRRAAAGATRRQAELEGRQALLNRLRFTFLQRPAQLTTALAEPARRYIAKTLERLDQRLIPRYEARRGALRGRNQLYQWLASRIGRDPDPGTRANDSRLIELLVALDLSDRGVRCGPMFLGRWLDHSNVAQIQDFRDWFARQADLPTMFDFEPFSGARAPTSWLCASMAIGSEPCPAWGVPGFSIITFDDLRLRRDTPTDTPENIDVNAILPQLATTRDLLFRAWDDRAFRGPRELKWQRTEVTGRAVSPAPGRPVPDLPREGFLAALYATPTNLPRMPRPLALPYAMGVRRNEVSETDADGAYRFEGLPRIGDATLRAVEVFRAEPGTGRITAATDIGRQLGDVTLYADLRHDPRPMRSVVFACEPFSLVGLVDPRFGQTLDEVVMLDARRNAEPQRYHAVLSDQMIAGFVEPGALTHLLFRFGRVGNRLLLVNAQENERREAETQRKNREGVDPPAFSLRVSASPRSSASSLGRGYGVPELNELGPLALATARDFHALDGIRLDAYRRAGVGSALIDSMQRQAGAEIERAEAGSQDGAVLMRHATASWSTSARVYQAVADLANDVVRGAIFLLLLCVPFAFCLERLLVASSDVYRQIGIAASIFAAMTLLLWSFHPAFAISASPLIIVLAFAILLMSTVVILVLYAKFDAELKLLRSGRGAAEGVSFMRGTVLLSVVLLGIANLRRRRFRTLLTSISVVLITFAVLCFTSTTRYLDTIALPVGIDASYAGVMLRQRGWRAMPASIVQDLRPLSGGRTVVERWWNVNPANYRDQVHVVALPAGDEGGGWRMRAKSARPSPVSILGPPSSASKARLFAATAILGLSPGESWLSRIAEVIGPEKFARLERGERDVIYFSRPIADVLGALEGDTVRLGGIDVQVAGIFDASAFDRRVRSLSGEPLAPLRYQATLLDAGGRALGDTRAEALALADRDAAGGELAAQYEHLNSTQFVIVPAALARLLPNASLRSVGVRASEGKENEDGRSTIENGNGAARPPPSSMLHPPSSASDASVRALSDTLARRFSIPLFAGDSTGVRIVSAASLLSVSGAAQVAIPLVLGGLIVFNTMLASIAERRREIHVYTSLGLAPLHVGALFVAEACVYGLIGSVVGYILGQGAATLLMKLGWLGNVTLNYSGSSAMLTLSLILLIVLLSALIPARLASRLAAPSIERTWKVPPPIDGRIEATLPFTLNRSAADGVLAFVADFLDAHREGSIGKFAADEVEAFSDENGGSRGLRGLRATIWLTPFDLGVRQRVTLRVRRSEIPEIFDVTVTLERLSGDDASWHRMNRPFLTELRRQFLQWRSLTPRRMREFVERSRDLFAC